MTDDEVVAWIADSIVPRVNSTVPTRIYGSGPRLQSEAPTPFADAVFGSVDGAIPHWLPFRIDELDCHLQQPDFGEVMRELCTRLESDCRTAKVCPAMVRAVRNVASDHGIALADPQGNRWSTRIPRSSAAARVRTAAPPPPPVSRAPQRPSGAVAKKAAAKKPRATSSNASVEEFDEANAKKVILWAYDNTVEGLNVEEICRRLKDRDVLPVLRLCGKRERLHVVLPDDLKGQCFGGASAWRNGRCETKESIRLLVDFLMTG